MTEIYNSNVPGAGETGQRCLGHFPLSRGVQGHPGEHHCDADDDDAEIQQRSHFNKLRNNSTSNNHVFQAVEFIAEHLRNEDEYVQVLLHPSMSDMLLIEYTIYLPSIRAYHTLDALLSSSCAGLTLF